MIDTLIQILRLIFAILPIALLCIASVKVNLAPTDRSKQVLMPAVAVVYSIVAMLLINPLSRWLVKIIEKIPRWIEALGGLSWLPPQVSSIISSVSQYIDNILSQLNLVFWVFFISNFVIIAVYLLIKKICITIMAKRVKTDGRLHGLVSEIFYEYFSEKNIWCIKECYSQTRDLFKVFYYSSIVISCLLMLASKWLYLKELMKTVFYPVFGIIIVGELFFFLSGITKPEYSNDILGEDEEAYKTVNYSLLRKFLRSIFGDKLLSESTSINSSLSYDVTTEQILSDLEKNEDQKISTFASFYDSLNKTGVAIDHNYLYSSLDMLNSKSILFNNPFYNDLIPYAFYPMNRVLLSHKKVLVILGRHSIEDDIIQWIENGVESVTNLPFMWNIGVLGRKEQNLDIGIITRSDVLDIELHEKNASFLEDVGFCIIIEPSKLVSTAQIGLNLIAKRCKGEEDKNVVYCLCDKNCDGLVDAMSHILMTSITEVSATKKHMGTVSHMCWEADEEYMHHRLLPNISRYLGFGTELSFAALKNQVSKTRWYGGEAFPVTDMRWIAKQYYYELTKYANVSTNQDSMDEHFITSANFWSAVEEKNCYTTVEDESYNMFEILRDFSTRTSEQGFINVISSEYLLKDYMSDNASIFEADAKAIPQIVADFTRSKRNTALRFILLMSTYPVPVKVFEKELSLLGITVYSLKKQIWYELYNCYADVASIRELPDNYEEAVEATYKLPIVFDNGKYEVTNDIIEVEETYNLNTGRMETTFAISDPKFIQKCACELKSAGYVAEDEKGEKYYLGSELSGHIYQKYLPGQFFTFGGKYYEMQYLTADGHVLVRRAADHINGRPTYRQVRNYIIHGVKESDRIGAQQNVSGMRVVKEYADISVCTPGYYRMEKYNDFSSAKHIEFEGEKNQIPVRHYRNKEILRIELPDINGKFSDNIRYTVTLLVNEIFRTLFAENQPYICAVTDTSFMSDNKDINPLTYSINSDNCEINKNAIYIIEDSQLDLGLTVAVERNLERIFSIVHDYIDWHFTTLENSLNPPEDPQVPIVFTEEPPEDAEPEEKPRGFKKITNWFKKVFSKIKGWFKRKPKKDKETDGENPENPDAPIDGEEKPEKGKRKRKKRKKGKKGEEPVVPQVPTDGEIPADNQPAEGKVQPVENENPTDSPVVTESEESLLPEDNEAGEIVPSNEGETDLTENEPATE